MNSWPTQICDIVGAQCHTVAWSGLGLVANCCGFPRAEETKASGGRGGSLGDGSHMMPSIFRRTLATDGDTSWDWDEWTPDALVINLGTNDGASARTPEYITEYTNLVINAFTNYGPRVRLRCICVRATRPISCGAATDKTARASRMHSCTSSSPAGRCRTCIVTPCRL
jgi:hypothetical protein